MKHGFSSLVFGLLVAISGILLFAFNAGYLPKEYKTIVFSWQMLLVAIGLSLLFSRYKWFAGIVLLLAGFVLLLPKLHLLGWDIGMRNAGPVALFVLGVIILCRAIRVRNKDPHELFFRRMQKNARKCHNWEHWEHWDKRHKETGYIDRNYIFGGGNEKLDICGFKGGDINCVFGGLELDLTDTTLAEGVHTLEINTVFGSVSLYIPVDWKIEIRQEQVFGRFLDNRPKSAFEVDENRKLILEVSSIFGGGEIRSKQRYNVKPTVS
ncbi:MAG: cell wall-active antibiotics response protein [Bacteroidales bacterium]|jgi:predicted membrane protein|nr:cell wall-active antibiotics response protein [Bacteroidales bacterium]